MTSDIAAQWILKGININILNNIVSQQYFAIMHLKLLIYSLNTNKKQPPPKKFQTTHSKVGKAEVRKYT